MRVHSSPYSMPTSSSENKSKDMPADDTPWFRRGWNLELLGVGGALVLIFVLVWIARQDQHRVELSPAGSAEQQKDPTVTSGSQLSPFVMSKAPFPNTNGDFKSVRPPGQGRIQLDAQESGYLIVVEQVDAELRRLHPPASSESAFLAPGRSFLDITKSEKAKVRGIHCAFPFAFSDLSGTPKQLVGPDGCVVTDLR